MIHLLFAALQWLVLNHFFVGEIKVIPLIYYLPWLAWSHNRRVRDLAGIALVALVQDLLLYTPGVNWLSALTTLFVFDMFRPRLPHKALLLLLLIGSIAVYALLMYTFQVGPAFEWVQCGRWVGWQMVLGIPAGVGVWLAYLLFSNKSDHGFSGASY